MLRRLREYADMFRQPQNLLIFIVAMYAAIFTVQPVFGTKIASLFGFRFLAGMVAYGFAYTLVDVVNNNWGKKEARFMAVVAAVIRAFTFFVLTPLILALPAAKLPVGYNELLGQAFRFFLAAELSMIASQMWVDIPVYQWFKQRNWPFWARYLATDFVSSSVGALVFAVIGLYGTGHTKEIAISNFCVATTRQVIFLPFAYVANFVVRKALNK